MTEQFHQSKIKAMKGELNHQLDGHATFHWKTIKKLF